MNVWMCKLVLLGALFGNIAVFGKPCDGVFLMDAVKAGDESLVAQLIEQGENVNWHDGCGFLDGFSILMAAVCNVPFDYDKDCFDFGIMQRLIDAGANVNAIDGCSFPHAGQPVLRFAIDSGLVEAVNILIDADVDVDAHTSSHGLVYCSRNIPILSYAIGSHASIKIIESLIKAGADINQRGWLCFWTPLMIAVKEGNAKAVRMLLDVGVDTTLMNDKDDNKTALDYAKEKGRLDIIQMLEAKD
jgi:ankyrin repeat protein